MIRKKNGLLIIINIFISIIIINIFLLTITIIIIIIIRTVLKTLDTGIEASLALTLHPKNDNIVTSLFNLEKNPTLINNNKNKNNNNNNQSRRLFYIIFYSIIFVFSIIYY